MISMLQIAVIMQGESTVGGGFHLERDSNAFLCCQVIMTIELGPFY